MTEQPADIESDFLAFCLANDGPQSATVADRVLARQGARTFLVERAGDARARPAVLRLARHDVLASAATGADWTVSAIRWLVDLNADWSESAEFCAKACRRSREAQNTARPWLDADLILRGDVRSVEGRARLHLYLSALRFEFRYAMLQSTTESVGLQLDQLDPYVHSLYAAAILIQDKPEARHELTAVVARGGDDMSVLHALVHALQFAETLPDRGQLMLDLLRRPAFAEHRDTTILRREATALRLLGRYDEALSAIDRSMMLLHPNEVDRYGVRIADRFRIVEERGLVERIRTEAARAQRAAERGIEEVSRDVIAQVSDEVMAVRRQVGDNLFRIVEILGIFTALIALVIGGVAGAAADGLRWWERGALIAIFGVVAIGFFALLQLIVRPDRDRRGSGGG